MRSLSCLDLAAQEGIMNTIVRKRICHYGKGMNLDTYLISPNDDHAQVRASHYYAW